MTATTGTQLDPANRRVVICAALLLPSLALFASVVANGMLFVNSGYSTFGQMAGNVLLAFGPPREE